MKPLLRGAALAAAVLAWQCAQAPLPRAEPKSAPPPPARAADVPQTEPIAILAGGIGGTYVRIASDLAAILEGEGLRILPIIGKGSVQNIDDLLTLRGVHVAIVQSDVLTHLRRQAVHGDIAQRIRYIAKLYNEELHIVAGKDIASIADLAGKAVNVDIRGSGTEITASTVFEALGIRVEPRHDDLALALEKVKSGEIAAAVYVAGKPARAVADLSGEDAVKLLPVPFTPALQDTYLPARFTAEDYPKLVRGAPVETVAVGAVMAVVAHRPGTEPYARLARFTDAFFSNLEALQQPPRHPKWREVSPGAQIPGWRRFYAATTWLAKHRPVSGLEEDFNRFIEGLGDRLGGVRLSKAQQEALFREFVRWREGQ